MKPLRLIHFGIDHPHGPLYRTTLAHHDGIELVGGCDADPARAAELLAREGLGLPLFGDVEAAIAACRPDAALITLPNDVTPAAIVTAARHGLHIFAEKPCAVSAEAFVAAREAVRAADVRFVPAYLRRFSPVAIAMRDLIADGQLGDLVSAQVTFATTSAALRNAAYLAGRTIEEVAASGNLSLSDAEPGQRHWLFDRARSGGGVMHWLGVHWLDLLRMATGDEFVRVNARLATRSPAPIGVEDVASVTMEASNGMIATLACGYVLPAGPDQTSIAIQGTDGWIAWDGASPELRVESHHPGWRAEPSRTLRFETDSIPGYGGVLGWTALDRFRAAVQEDAPLPVDADDAMQVLELLDAIHASAG